MFNAQQVNSSFIRLCITYPISCSTRMSLTSAEHSQLAFVYR